MKRVALLVVVLMQGLSAMAQNAEIKQAERLLDKDQPTKALEILNQAITKYPEATNLYYYLGYVQLKTGDTGKALQTFEKGVAADEKEAINHVGLGAVRMQEKKTAEAKTFFDKALSMSKSKDVDVLQAVADAYLVDVKHAETAIKLLEKAKTLDPNDPRTYMLMGEADLLQNKGGPAISNSERALRLDPTNAKPYYDIALVYMRSQNYPLAEENLQKAISTDPEFTLAYKELGELHYSMKAGEKAAKAYESYMKLKEKPTEQDSLRMAFFYFMAKNFTRANEVFKPIAEKPNASATTLKYYVYSLVESGNLQEAQRIFEKYFSITPADKIEAGDYVYHGNLMVKLGQDSLAVLSYQKSLAINPDQQDISQTVAETLYKARRYPEAVTAYEQLLNIRKKPLSLDYYGLGRAYYYTNQFEKADTAFQKLAEMQPTRTISYLWLGRTKANLDENSEKGLAKPAYEKLIEVALAAPEANGNKRDLIEAYMYMGVYYSQRDDLGQAKSYFEKVLAIDPAHEKAKEYLDLLKQQK